MRLGFPEIAPQCVSLVGAPWINRQLNLMAHPRLANVGEVKQAHLAVGVMRVAVVTAGNIEVLQGAAGLDEAIGQPDIKLCGDEAQISRSIAGLAASEPTPMPAYFAEGPQRSGLGENPAEPSDILA